MKCWQRVVCSVPKQWATQIENLYNEYGAIAVTMCAADRAEEIFDQLDQQYRIWAAVEITAIFDQDTDITPLMIAFAVLDIEGLRVMRSEFAEKDWVEVWQAALEPIDFGRGLFVCPEQCARPPEAKTVVVLEPGMAFGTGTHPTTAMCMRWLATHGWHGEQSLLDFGCGSGLLAIAAAKLGARKVLACDIDPDAVGVCRENIQKNGLTNVTATLNAELGGDKFDVIVANILLAPLIHEQPVLLAHAKPQASIVLSGILVSQADTLLAAYGSQFRLRVTATEGEWALVSGTLR